MTTYDNLRDANIARQIEWDRGVTRDKDAPTAEAPWLLMSHGLYWRPNAQGYTGRKDRAGRFTKEEADAWTRHGDVTAVCEADALPLMFNDSQEITLTYANEQIATLTAKLEAERATTYRLKLAIAGGEDAPGYANTLTVEQAEKSCRDTEAKWKEDRERADAAVAEAKALREALEPFANAATTLKAEYGDLMKPDTGCNIRFEALELARTALGAAP